MNKAVFIDRDDTINRDVPYCSRPEDFEMLPGVPEGIRLLNEKGYKVIVITNQSGVARSYFTEERLAEIHDKMRADLAARGARVDAVYYCPHHPDEGCACRKPSPEMVLRAAREMDIDLPRSWFIGDREMDMEAGGRAGCRTVLIAVNGSSDAGMEFKPEYIAPDVAAAARHIIGAGEKQS